MTLHQLVANLSPDELLQAARRHFPDTCVRLPDRITETPHVLVTYRFGESVDGRLTSPPLAAAVALTECGWYLVTGEVIKICQRVDKLADLQRLMEALDESRQYAP